MKKNFLVEWLIICVHIKVKSANDVSKEDEISLHSAKKRLGPPAADCILYTSIIDSQCSAMIKGKHKQRFIYLISKQWFEAFLNQMWSI